MDSPICKYEYSDAQKQEFGLKWAWKRDFKFAPYIFVISTLKSLSEIISNHYVPMELSDAYHTNILLV